MRVRGSANTRQCLFSLDSAVLSYDAGGDALTGVVTWTDTCDVLDHFHVKVWDLNNDELFADDNFGPTDPIGFSGGGSTSGHQFELRIDAVSASASVLGSIVSNSVWT